MILTDEGHLIDETTWRRLDPPVGRRVHPILCEAAGNRSFVLFNPRWDETYQTEHFLCDPFADKILGSAALYPVSANSKYNGEDSIELSQGLLAIRHRSAGASNGSADRYLLPWEPITTDSDILQLWVEVLSRRTLGSGDEVVTLDEADWDRRRRDLGRRLPTDASILLTAAADDAGRWRRAADREKAAEAPEAVGQKP